MVLVEEGAISLGGRLQGTLGVSILIGVSFVPY